MVIKMLTEFGRIWMNIEENFIHQRERKYLKGPNRSHRAKEGSN